MRVFHLNVQGLAAAKLGEIEVFLEECCRDYDFLCLSEHWLSRVDFPECLILGEWRAVSSFARTDKKRDGVVVLSKKCLMVETVNCINALSCEVDCEIAAIFL